VFLKYTTIIYPVLWKAKLNYPIYKRTSLYPILNLQTGRQGIDTCQRQTIFPLACVQTTSEAHPAYCTMVPRAKRGRGVTLTTHPYILPTSRMSRSYVLPLPLSACMASSGAASLYFLSLLSWVLGTFVGPAHCAQFVIRLCMYVEVLLAQGCLSVHKIPVNVVRDRKYANFPPGQRAVLLLLLLLL
jgi:hypothetical protein